MVTVKHKPQCGRMTVAGEVNKHWESYMVTISYSLFTENNKLLSLVSCTVSRQIWYLHECWVESWDRNLCSFWLFFLHETRTTWQSFTWLTDGDADRRTTRHWPAPGEARKPSHKMLHHFWQLPPSSSLDLSLWAGTQWVFGLGQIYQRFKHHWKQPGRLIRKRLVRYEARGERFQHLCLEWETKPHREAERWSRCTCLRIGWILCSTVCMHAHTNIVISEAIKS